MGQKLNVNEIFRSIQGEGTRAGLPFTFVRLAGCNLRCKWCDTEYARHEGLAMSLADVMKRVAELGCWRVAVTGGEPLTQPQTGELLSRLADTGYETLLETNGSLDIAAVDSRVVKIVDFKCPASGQADANRWQNVEHLNRADEVKFVIADHDDYDFARAAVEKYDLTHKCAVIFSPVSGRLAPTAIAEWILQDKLDVKLGLQLHKIIWPDRDRGV
ncbi:MAG: radical SAM protein [Planctomycetota bacterium]|nr:radical SAM protein [Planctomycetota bacterium]